MKRGKARRRQVNGYNEWLPEPGILIFGHVCYHLSETGKSDPSNTVYTVGAQMITMKTEPSISSHSQALQRNSHFMSA
jgi:hypothetical protein